MSSSETTIVTITLEMTVQVERDSDLSLCCLAALRGAVKNVGPERKATGTGFNYAYTKKKSRRGLRITAKPPLEGE